MKTLGHYWAVVLKDEIRRRARKEVRQQTGSTAQAAARYRREIARLKRQTSELQRKTAFLEAQERKRLAKAEPPQEAAEGARFSARSVKAQRQRTGLSAADYARLVGVSPLTIYNWEQGKTRPRQEQLASLVALRGIGKRGGTGEAGAAEEWGGEGMVPFERRVRQVCVIDRLMPG